MEVAGAPSFSLRRPAATTLPTFALPPPNSAPVDIAYMKYQSQYQRNPMPPSPSSGNHQSAPQLQMPQVLTPPSAQGDSPLNSNMNHPGGSQSAVSTQGMYATYPTAPSGHGAWPTPGSSTPYSYNAPSTSYHHSALTTSSNGNGTTTSSPTIGVSQPPTPSSAAAHVDTFSRVTNPPSYFVSSSTTNHPPAFPAYPQSHSAPLPSPTASLSSHGPPHQQHHHHQQQQQLPPPPLSTGSHPTQTPTTTAPSGMAHPAQATHYRYPPGQLPLPGSGPPQQPVHFAHPVPSMANVLSNVGHPNQPVTMLPMPSSHSMPGGPGLHHGHAVPHYAAPYAASIYPGSTQTQPERPFKCETCSQAFNRNHDLKRHKRIHLAVKPFPCGSCDKSFSRKDALKRHRLVKGCGEPQDNRPSSNGSTTAGTSNDSQVNGTSTGSNSAEQTPTTLRTMNLNPRLEM